MVKLGDAPVQFVTAGTLGGEISLDQSALGSLGEEIILEGRTL